MKIVDFLFGVSEEKKPESSYPKKEVEREPEQKPVSNRTRRVIDKVERRRAELELREIRTQDKEQTLELKKRNRNLKKQEREAQDTWQKEDDDYRVLHPGFFDPRLRIHSVIALTLAVIGTFFAISFILKSLSGSIGSALSYGLLGCFSYTAFLFPVIFLLHAFFWHEDIRRRTVFKKALAFLPALLFSSVFAAVFAPGFDQNAFDAASAFANGNNLVGGGAVGEAVGSFLCRYIGITGVLILGLASLGFFLALYFADPIKLIYRALSTKINENRVKRAKRKAMGDGFSANNALGGVQEEPLLAPSKASALPEAKKQLPAGKQTAADRRRGIFSDWELQTGDLPVSRSSLSADKAKPFDFENAEIEKGGIEELSQKPAAPFPAFGGDDMVDDDLSVTLERVRPVRMVDTAPLSPVPPREPETKQEAPAFSQATYQPARQTPAYQSPARQTPARQTPTYAPLGDNDDEDDGETGMQHFRNISVSADRPQESPKKEEDDRFFEAAPRQSMGERIAATPICIEDDDVEKREDNFVPIHRPQEATPVQQTPRKPSAYPCPPISLLEPPTPVDRTAEQDEIEANTAKLLQTFQNLRVNAQVTGYVRGPRVTRYEVVPDAGTRVRSILNLSEDIALNLAVDAVRIAQISDKAAVGIEVPNRHSTLVRLRELLDTENFRNYPDFSYACLGQDVSGRPVYFDLAKMPHLLIAGATNMGKSVCINSIIVSLLYKSTPRDLRFILIDPKKVEFTPYDNIPNLIVPVVTDPQKAAGALAWAVNEMERRYSLIQATGLRDLKEYNKKLIAEGTEPLPKLVIIIDELADLMLSAANSVEVSIARITAKARAAGIHLIIGTQRPSVDVITGTIKSNITSRIALHVASQIDARTILDNVGAEKLLDRGDMLFSLVGEAKPRRVQGAYVSNEEVYAITEYLRQNGESFFTEESESILADMEREAEKCVKKKGDSEEKDDPEAGANVPSDDDDQHLLWSAIEIGLEYKRLSTSLLERRLSIGYGKAAKILDTLAEKHIVPRESEGSRGREILITREEFNEMRMRGVADALGKD